MGLHPTEGDNFSNVITCASYVKGFFVNVMVFLTLIKSYILNLPD